MKYLRLIREFKVNNVIEAKMSEIKDLVSNVSDQEILYEWENKHDHQLFISFSYNEDYFKYELDIKDLFIKKFKNDKIEYDNTLTSLEEGLTIIYDDVVSIIEK